MRLHFRQRFKVASLHLWVHVCTNRNRFCWFHRPMLLLMSHKWGALMKPLEMHDFLRRNNVPGSVLPSHKVPWQCTSWHSASLEACRIACKYATKHNIFVKLKMYPDSWHTRRKLHDLQSPRYICANLAMILHTPPSVYLQLYLKAYRFKFSSAVYKAKCKVVNERSLEWSSLMIMVYWKCLRLYPGIDATCLSGIPKAL